MPTLQNSKPYPESTALLAHHASSPPLEHSMTLKPSQIQAILQAKQEDFTRFDQRSLTLLMQYRSALMNLVERSSQLLDSPQQLMLSIGDYGATPLESWAGTNHGVLPCNLKWNSREQSLIWVQKKLAGVTTFAVDGSQIFPGKDLSIPVALVQIGWFENPHSKSGEYEKDIDVDVMTPSDLKASNSGEPVDRRVNFRRLEMEIDRLVQYIEAHAQDVAQGKSYLVFFDGSLLATFAKDFEFKLRQGYVGCFV
ncbi:MAG: DNA double-strand break repair nuclease NurA, partial [Merismopedia sp. SIO2A8]|nr:DNA double-strand break repair nuclease NurA [Merismopedia sp. SIO2A8]